ncbi:MAG: GAF domain-containing protein, partial [Myxococcales bacterium]|nr:GAF domain-containing protein [Myxococcales bacterium]
KKKYRYVGLDGSGAGDGVNARYRFQHDRVQQAAYALIEPERQASVHLAVGRRLRGDDSRLLEVVAHLDAGRALIDDPAERLDLARMNLRAAERARNTAAYRVARDLFEVGLELVGEVDRTLVWELSVGLQQCAYLTGAYDDADTWSHRLLELAPDRLARAEVLATRTRQYATVGRMHDSIHAAIEGLNLLGMEFEEDPTPADLEEELASIGRNLAGRPIPSLIDAPPCTDPVHLSATRLLMEIFAAAFLSGSGTLFPYLVARLVNLSLEHGNSPESAFAYAAYGMLLCGKLDDPGAGYAFGRLGVALNERFDDVALKSRVIYVYAMFVHHWTESWQSMTPWFQKGIEAGYQAGDLLYLAYSAQDCILWDPTLDLPTATAEQRKYLSIVRDTGYRDSYDSGTLYLQMELAFMGLTESPFSMDTEDFDERATVAGMRARGFMTGIANHHIYKAEIHYLHDDPAGAMEHIAAQEGLLASSMSLPQIVRFHIIAFLTRSALLADAPGRRAELLPAMRRSVDQMARWASHCPWNFLHLEQLMRAELETLGGALQPALALYEQAIANAGVHGFLRDEAMANELAGKALLRAGMAKAAEGYLRAAVHGYEHFGATRKVVLLETAHPWLVRENVSLHLKTMSLDRTSGSVRVVDIDMASVMKASQAISGELVLDQLWDRTLDVLIENAGAQWGAFVLQDGGELRVHAWKGGRTPESLPCTVVPEMLPTTLLRSVLRRRQSVVVADARSDTSYNHDPYFERAQPRSVLCIPLARHGSFEGVIYLENALTAGAFTEERIEVLKLLSAQAAISTENARLYEDQTRLVAAQRRFVPDEFLENLGHRDIANVQLGESVSREMSVMFSDLRGFTPLTERLGPRNVIALLNDYFSALEVPITGNGGFIDSFNGDEIMALFGVAPDCALDAGIAMWRALDGFNAASGARGGPELIMGVGVNTGDLVLGTVGGRDRLKCGVVGDPVNLASRIEQLTKHYDAPFLIGESTFRALQRPERFSLRLVDRVAVKGKTEGVRLYEVLDAAHDDRREAKESTRPLLEAATEHYAARRFAAALDLAEQARAMDPIDPVLSILAGRCARYHREPPPPEWNGIEALTHK